MPEPEEDLKATAADVAADAARLEEIELAKLELDPTDPRMEELSAEAEAIARDLGVKTAVESELVRGLAEPAPPSPR